jgi:NADH-quinone oxidoreductase subunit K
MRGNVIVVFTIAIAAAEAVVGLAILLALFRNRRTVNLDEVREMKG